MGRGRWMGRMELDSLVLCSDICQSASILVWEASEVEDTQIWL